MTLGWVALINMTFGWVALILPAGAVSMLYL
jgi:hypothetical protein